MELISIIVPVYNVEKYLDECIKSLLHQTYSNVEIILVNDGSKDSSGEMCNNWALKDNRIKVIHKENEGLGLARNTGLDYITGKYVTFIDSDDYADSDLIESLYNAIKENNADTCIGGFKRVDELGNNLYKESYTPKIYINSECVSVLLSRMLGSSPEKSDAIRMSVWNVLYSVDIIKKNNVIFPSEREFISEDIIFDLDYYRFSTKTVIINNTAYNYRVNNLSLTKKYQADKFIKCKILYNELLRKINLIYKDNSATLRLQRQFFVNIRSCIQQENIKVSKLSYQEAIKNIKNICSDHQVQSIIRSYPINKLNIKQRIFLILIKYRLSNLLYFYAFLTR